jgi:outer membrane protein OmpA-like peptidoglycan-associated protein
MNSIFPKFHNRSYGYSEENPGYDYRENAAATVGAVAAGVGAAVGVADFASKQVEVSDQRTVFGGAYTLTTKSASVTPYPAGLGTERSVSRNFVLVCRSAVMSDDKLVFSVSLNSDCYNIYSVAIGRNESASSALYASSFKINFSPNSQQVRGVVFPNIRFTIDGTWDPAGPFSGYEDFSGTLIVQANGAMSLSINSPNGWVKPISRGFGPAFNCPLPTTPDPGAPAPSHIPAPDQRGNSQAPRSTPNPSQHSDSRQKLLKGGNVSHVFFLTGSVKLGIDEVNRLRSWLNQLSTPLLEQMRAGNVVIFVTGHTSRSGTPDRNRTISNLRADSAANSLREVIGPNANIKVQGMGADQVVGNSDNDQADRRATIRININ